MGVLCTYPLYPYESSEFFKLDLGLWKVTRHLKTPRLCQLPEPQRSLIAQAAATRTEGCHASGSQENRDNKKICSQVSPKKKVIKMMGWRNIWNKTDTTWRSLEFRRQRSGFPEETSSLLVAYIPLFHWLTPKFGANHWLGHIKSY